VAIGTQTLAETDWDGRRLRSIRGRWCTDPGRYWQRREKRPWPLVHRPWPLLTETGEDWGVTMVISWVDIVFDSFLERRGVRDSNQTTSESHEVNASSPRWRLFETLPYIPLLRGVVGGA